MFFKKIFLAVLACCILTSGCAMTKSGQTMQATYYPACVRPLAAMQKADTEVAKTTASSALLGALAGAVIGFVTTGKPIAALVGAGIGAVGGTAVGYSYAKFRQISDENTRFASIRVTANQDLTNANRQQLYAYECLQCYMREFEGLQKAYKDGLLSQEDYRLRYAEIRTNMQKLGTYIGFVNDEITRTEDEFEKSYANQPVTDNEVEPVATNTRKKSKPVTSTPKRNATSTQDIARTIALQRESINKAQEKNDEDLSKMLDDFSGKIKPPKQNIVKIAEDYNAGYKATQQQMEDLRATHKAALDIMDKAAIEAGIDMV